MTIKVELRTDGRWGHEPEEPLRSGDGYRISFDEVWHPSGWREIKYAALYGEYVPRTAIDYVQCSNEWPRDWRVRLLWSGGLPS